MLCGVSFAQQLCPLLPQCLSEKVCFLADRCLESLAALAVAVVFHPTIVMNPAETWYHRSFQSDDSSRAATFGSFKILKVGKANVDP